MINSICRFIFYKMFGWQIHGEVPTVKKYLFVVVPHTSNWDFVLGWLAIRALDLNVTIFVKDSFYVFPFKTLCKFFGVAPVNRRENTNFVDSMSNQFASKTELAAVITPEGTRQYIPRLKSGYYYLAKKAQVSIVAAGPNYKEKSFTITAARDPLASFEEDEQHLIEFSKTMYGKNPDQSYR